MTVRPGPPASRASRFDSVARLVRYGARRFQAAKLVFGHGTTSATEEAAFLTAHALGVSPGALAAHWARRPSRASIYSALGLFDRRIRERRPAAYLAREAWLGALPFYVDERAIVPRSHLAGLLRNDLAPWIADPRRISSVLDLCTGSGCLAVLLARSFRRATVDAVDVSPAALAVASINVRRYRLGRRVHLIESDLFSGLGGRRYDLIVSNPPYVTARSMRRLPREYRHEPPLALAAGADGLAFVRRIVSEARAHLNPGGLLVVEVGSGRRRVERAFPGIAFTWPETEAGHPAFIATCEELP
jgi:ribosomal protein L3 glutamine methyltransferase